MKKIAIVFVLASFLTACTKDVSKLNIDTKKPSTVPSYSLFTDAQRRLSNTVTSSNVNLNIFRLIEQQWQETTYTDESNYDIITRPIPDDIWNALYRDVLSNFQNAKKVIPTDVTDAGIQKNEIAITDIMQVYTYYYLLTTFGNIPYTEALDPSKPFPKFDDARTVYNDLLKRLDADIAALNPASGSFGNADVIYNGDPAMWKKFAATLKLKMGITLDQADAAAAKTIVESAVATGVFTSNADNAQFQYLSAPPNTNPIWVDLVQSGRQDFVACTTTMNYLTVANANNPLGNVSVQDPRLPYYFTTNASGGYTGAAPGTSAQFSANSKPSGPLLVSSSIGKITNPDFPALLLDYSETEFNLAEAVAKGYSVSGTEAAHYNAGIAASVAYWSEGAADPTAYLAQSNVAFTTAIGPTATDLQRIALQKYLALYNRGWDAWIETRRLVYPMLVAPPDAKSGFPARFTYPVNEQNINSVNYKQAATAIGGDAVATPLFFVAH